jgi:hypothetical protein
MNKKLNINVLHLFLIAVAIAGILFLLDTYISNRLSTNGERIVSGIICGFFAVPLFVLGATKSLRMKSSAWAALNIVAILFIIGWTLWLGLILYTFKDFQLVIPG